MNNIVVSKIRSESPNRRNTAVKTYNYLYYIATREGVDLSQQSENETYLQYIHERPRSHGLFGNIETDDIDSVLSNIKERSKKQVVFRGILSLDERDARDLGFLDKENWRKYLSQALPLIGEKFGIQSGNLQWVAAFHREKNHPHIHFMIWDQNINNVQNSFISQPQQHYCRELFSKLFTEEERKSLANKKYLSREELIKDSKTELQMLVDEITFEEARPFISKIDKEYRQKFNNVFSELLDSLPRDKLDKLNKFQYLSPSNKEKVLSVVQVLLTNKVLKKEYDDFLNYHYRIAKDYSPSKKEIKVAVLKAKEDIEKRLCNLVLREIRDMRSIAQEISQEPEGTSSVEPQEPEGTSPAEPQEPKGTSPAEPQEPKGTSPAEPQEPKGTSPVEPQEPEGTSPGELQEPKGTSPGEPQEPEGTSPGELQEPKGTSPGEPQEPEGTSPGELQKPKGTSPVEPQEPKGTSPVEPQEPEGTSPGELQEPKGTSPVEPQEPKGTSPGELQEPKGTSPGEPQELGYHAKQEESYHMYRLVNTFLDALLYANNTRTPSSVYSSGKDKGNVKALREWKREQGFSMENSNY